MIAHELREPDIRVVEELPSHVVDGWHRYFAWRNREQERERKKVEAESKAKQARGGGLKPRRSGGRK